MVVVIRKDGTESQKIMTQEETLQFAFKVFSEYYEVQ